MKVIYSAGFIDSAKKLSEKLKIKLDKLVQILKENPFHPSLHTKHLSGRLSGLLSFRITRDWRVIFRKKLGYSLQFFVIHWGLL